METKFTRCDPRTHSAGVEYDELCEKLEKEEIDAPNGVPPVHVYQQLLALYLLQNDLTGAKFLWQRIPASSKSSLPELCLIWAVGQKLWQRDYQGVYAALAKDWSSVTKEMMEKMNNQIVERSINLVHVAYTSLRLEDFCLLVGMSKEAALKKVQSLDWTYESNTDIVIPSPIPPKEHKSLPSEEQLGRLTEYVSFLEN